MKLQSGFPFSLIRYGLPYAYPKLEQNIKTNTVIVGGGISGALTAYHLLKAGIECIVVDGRSIGLGSTCASTSLIQYEIDVPLSRLSEKIGNENAVRAYRDCHEAIFKLHDICADVKFSGFEFNKSLYYAATKKDVEFLKEECRARADAGLSVEWLDEKQISKHFKFQAPAAILSKDAAHTDAYMLTHQILQWGIARGLHVYDRTFIKDIDYKTTSATLTTSDDVTIKAENVVLATGYEVTEQINKKIVKLHSTYAIISENMPDENPLLEKDVLIWSTGNPYLYLRSTKDGRIIIGGRDESFYAPKKRDELITKKSRQLASDYKKLFPDMRFKPEFTWSGTFGETVDGLPFIGTYGDNRQRYFALGFGGNGITFSVIAAEIICALLLSKKPKNLDLYTFDRA